MERGNSKHGPARDEEMAHEAQGLLHGGAHRAHDVGKISVDDVPIPTALRAYEAFDRREPGWTKVTLEVG